MRIVWIRILTLASAMIMSVLMILNQVTGQISDWLIGSVLFLTIGLFIVLQLVKAKVKK
ncbi:hypothetical protein [Sporolactobacillus sp. THM19-2]|uniref:hypothetical protein n=1 Tax=Sporolactobacillus sp. THM19-2 TaxID=2511171 RepID=UPI0013EAA076|nr:hypothetical protein [Sporolactobacillus sp. THM19-2]